MAIIATRRICSIALLMGQNTVLPWPACHPQRQAGRQRIGTFPTADEKCWLNKLS